MTKRQLRWLLLVIFGLIVLVFWWHSRAVTPDKPHPSALSAHQTIVFPKETNGLPGQAQLKSGQLVEKDGKQYRTLSASLPQQSGKIYFYCQVSEIGDKKGIKSFWRQVIKLGRTMCLMVSCSSIYLKRIGFISRYQEEFSAKPSLRR